MEPFVFHFKFVVLQQQIINIYSRHISAADKIITDIESANCPLCRYDSSGDIRFLTKNLSGLCVHPQIRLAVSAVLWLHDTVRCPSDVYPFNLNINPAMFALSARNMSVTRLLYFCMASQLESPLADVGAADTELP